MRHIVCRFKDEAHFFRHLTRSGRRGPKNTLSFLGDFDAEDGTEVRLTLVVSNHSERYDVTMKVKSHRPMLGAVKGLNADKAMWRYEAVVTDQDAIWLEMFASKLAMLQRMSPSASVGAKKKDQTRALCAA